MAAITAIAAATAATMTAVGTGMSFMQAAEEKKFGASARQKANEAFNKVEKLLDVNYMKALGLSKEPYERQREELASATGQLIQAGIESERGAAATAGRALMASQKMGQQISSQQIKDIEALEKSIAEEEGRLRDAKATLQLGVATGAGKAAADAERRRIANVQAGLEGVGSTLSAAMSEDIMPLYGKKTSEGVNADFKIPAVDAGYAIDPLQQNPIVFQPNTIQDNQVVLDPTAGFNIFAQ